MRQGDSLYFVPGMFGMALAAAAIASLLASIWLLRAYRRSVAALMSGASGDATAGAAAAAPASVGRAFAPAVTLERERRRRAWSALGVYAVAGLGGAVVLTLGSLADLGTPFSIWRAAVLVALYLGPLVLVAPIVLGLTARRSWIPLAVYVGAIVLYFLWRDMGATSARLADAARLLLVTYGPSCAVLALFFSDRIRSVGPALMVFLSMVVTGTLGVVGMAGLSPAAMRAMASVAVGSGLGAAATLVCAHALALAVFAAVGWLGVRALVRLQARGHLRDQDLQISVLWLFFALIAGLDFMFAAPALFWLGALASAVFLALSMAGFTLLARARDARRAAAARPRLLILRVFAAGRAVERLFRFVDNRWRTLGEVCLIGGADLATRTIEPRHALDLLGRNLARSFVADAARLRARLDALDAPPDATGRSHLQEFFCRADMWKSAVTALVDHADVVLMDLRRLSAASAGARWELDLLVRRFPLERVVFVIDDSTDRRVLSECAAAARTVDIGRARSGDDALWTALMSAASAP